MSPLIQIKGVKIFKLHLPQNSLLFYYFHMLISFTYNLSLVPIPNLGVPSKSFSTHIFCNPFNACLLHLFTTTILIWIFVMSCLDNYKRRFLILETQVPFASIHLRCCCQNDLHKINILLKHLSIQNIQWFFNDLFDVAHIEWHLKLVQPL